MTSTTTSQPAEVIMAVGELTAIRAIIVVPSLEAAWKYFATGFERIDGCINEAVALLSGQYEGKWRVNLHPKLRFVQRDPTEQILVKAWLTPKELDRAGDWGVYGEANEPITVPPGFP